MEKPSLLDTSVYLGLLGLLLWLPLPLGSNRDWSMGLLVLLVGVLAMLWAAARFKQNKPDSRALRAAWPMLALLLVAQGWVALQLLLGISLDVGASFQYLMLGLAYSLLFVMVLSVFHTRRRLTVLLAVLVVSGTLQAFYGTLMTLSGLEWTFFTEKTSYQSVASGTFVNRNHLAGYLEMTMACGIGLMMALRDGGSFSWKAMLELIMGPKARLRIGLVIMVIGLVMSRSRMGNTAFFVSLVVIGGIFILLNKENRGRNVILLASFVLIDILVISQYFGLDKLKDRLINTRFSDEVVNEVVVARQNEVRDDVYLQALPALEQHWLTGSGAGSFEAIFPQYMGPDIAVMHFDHAHNDFIQFAIEYGLIGTLPLAAFVLLAFWHALRALWRTESWYRSGIGFASAMGMLALMIHSFTDFNLQIPANAATFVVLCAIAVLAGQHEKERKKRRG
ncbi:O-antigen ligase family protein [Oceanisphaera arctica]|uniref:O-antigen polymerase n=1 Tax=Oceanisphaera arctica TaxID=641510 RepID=A0A2P5TK99_9GAMM|nr:O-antigen ligase family protein [Oceanisphaera arctica]PPL15540.1 O-antigen polymerase [Oceanisphaera arctica]GHA27755.1 polymerase [Oceanisphaera arctica]